MAVAEKRAELAREKEFRVYGPPGTGKTTFLSKQIKKASKRYGHDKILVASFTRAAAEEIAGRDVAIPPDNIGTLHAHCYRALNYPDLVVNGLKKWNEEYPQYRLSGQAYKNGMSKELDVSGGQTEGDRLLKELQVLRARMKDRRMWPAEIRHFQEKWEEFKQEHGFFDFTDLIETALAEEIPPPRGTEIGFYDEVQDFTRLELALVRQWADDMERIMIVGDDDQNLYSFKGASPEAFLKPEIPDEQVKVLNQSYRVPQAVQQLAQKWIEQIPAEQRKQKEYKPTERPGHVELLRQANYKKPRIVIDAAEEYIKEDKEVMLLASCSYMLEKLLKELRKRGLPFHNPYARKRGDWNPLYASGITGRKKIMAFLRPQNALWGDKARMWTLKDLYAWTRLIKAKGNLKRGAKKEIRQIYKDEVEDSAGGGGILSISELLEYVEEDALERALEGDVNWLKENMLGSQRKKNSIQYPLRILEKQGFDALLEQPAVKVGTIHSVKGGEADAVFLFPDLSPSGFKQWNNPNQKPAIVRQFYVAMTRAKEALIMCNATGSNSISIPYKWIEGAG